jgi:DNA-binding MarR family transcriptional regulator
MTRPAFDEIIHAPLRLQICALLSPLQEAEFAVLREELSVSDSVLSKHLRQLEQASYIAIRKQAANGRQRTWAALTAKGRRAFSGHIAELRRIAALSETRLTAE